MSASKPAEKALACDSESLHNAYYQVFIYNRKAMHSELANP